MSNNTGPETSTTIALSPRQERAIAARDAIEAGAVKPAPLVPRTFQEAQAFAGALAESPLMPEALRKQAANVLVVILAGVEMGLTPMQSIRLHHVIEGVPRLSSAAIAGIVMASPLCEYLRCVESTETRSTWVTKRVGEPEKSCTWTKERAQTAGLWGKRTWATYPTNLLNARARKELCEIVYPDICAGLLSAEEAEDMAADKERSAPPVFVAPQGPPPGVPVVDTAPAKRGPGRPPKDKPPIDAQSTERPTSAAGAAPASTSSSSLGSTSTASTPSSTASNPSSPAAAPTGTDRWGQAIGDPSTTSRAQPSGEAQTDGGSSPSLTRFADAVAAVEAKRAVPTSAAGSSDSAATTSSGSPMPSDEGTQQIDVFDDEPDAKSEMTVEGFFAWLAAPKTTKRQLAIDAAPWVKWTGEAFAKDSPELLRIRKAYAERKAGLPE
jgi:hypothetical protein